MAGADWREVAPAEQSATSSEWDTLPGVLPPVVVVWMYLADQSRGPVLTAYHFPWCLTIDRDDYRSTTSYYCVPHCIPTFLDD